MKKDDRLAALVKDDGLLRSLTAQWASLNRDIARWNDWAAEAPTGGVETTGAPDGLARPDQGGVTAGQLQAKKSEREECARRYIEREAALRVQAGF